MSQKPKAKQLDVIVGQAHWNTTGFTIPAATSITVTSLFSGYTSGGNDTTVGVYTGSPQNKVYLRAKATGKALEDDSQRIIFGRLTESGSVWTISFYVLISGSETAYDFTGHDEQGNTAEFRWCESVQLKDANPTAVVEFGEGIDEINASNPLAHNHIVEELTVTAQNTINSLTQAPKDANDVKLIVNKLVYQVGDDFTLGGTGNKDITWSAVNSGFNVETTDEVIAFYEY